MILFKNKGQAAIELLLSVGALMSIYMAVHQVLIPAIDNSTVNLIKAREATWNRIRDRELTLLSGDYRLNEHTEALFDPLNRLLPVSLEGENLRQLKKIEGLAFYPMSRLTDSWQAKTNNELSSRPASLIVNNSLSGEVTHLVQDGLGWLFLAEELSSDSLVFGTVSPDVIPEEAYQ